MHYEASPPNKPEPGRCAVFRLEFGDRHGWGHLIRCSALAEELRRRDWRCVLWTAGNLEGVPRDCGRAFAECLAVPKDWRLEPPELVRSSTLLLIDLYDFSDAELAELAGRFRGSPSDSAPRILAIDDEAQRRFSEADWVLNSRLELVDSTYAPRVGALLGERFALLRSGLSAPVAPDLQYPAGAEPVLVMLGGTDPAGWTATVLHALADLDPKRLFPIVVRSSLGGGANDISAALARFAGSRWLEGLDAAHLAGWAKSCTFAVTAAGGSLYELAFLQVPFVALIVADNQQEQAHAVGKCWQMPVVDLRQAGPESIVDAVRMLRARSGIRAYAKIDGRGAVRVADVIETIVATGTN